MEHTCNKCQRTFQTAAKLSWHTQFTTSCVEPVDFDVMNEREIRALRDQAAELTVLQSKANDLAAQLAECKSYIDDLHFRLQDSSMYGISTHRPSGSVIVKTPVFLLAEQPYLGRVKVFYSAGLPYVHDGKDIIETRKQIFDGLRILKMAVSSFSWSFSDDCGSQDPNNALIYTDSMYHPYVECVYNNWIYVKKENIDALWDRIVKS